MKAKELKKLINDLPDDADILCPDENNTAADNFRFNEVGVIFNAAGLGSTSAPHSVVDKGVSGSSPAFLLEGFWTLNYICGSKKESRFNG